MTPARIIKQAAADGVRLALSATGTIKAAGDAGSVARWLPIIRENRPGILAVLQEASNDPHGVFDFSSPSDAGNDAKAEDRRRRALAALAENPALRVAVVCDGEGDPVPVAVAIRDKGTCELLIPAARFDPFALLELVERHGATVH